MIRTMQEIVDAAAAGSRCSMAVACAADKAVLEAVCAAEEKGLISPILVGDKAEILRIALENGLKIKEDSIVDIPDKAEACQEAARLTGEGRASLIMKGMVDTSYIMKAVLNKDNGLRTGRVLSHVAAIEVGGYDHLFMVTDSALNIAPDLSQKVHIAENAAEAAHALGIDEPKVAVLCAVEKVNPKMQCTLDAAELKKMNEEGAITGCVIDGPLALDNAVSPEAAKHKGIESRVAGNADILLVPEIEAGNMLNKAMEHFAHGKKAGVIMGAKVPVVLVSRATSAESKMYSIALGSLIAAKTREEI